MQPTCTAQEFVDSHIKPGRMVLFMKPTCPYCRRAEDLLCQYPFKRDSLVIVDITVTRNTERIQDYFQQLTGARTVSLGCCSKRSGMCVCGGGENTQFLFLVRALKGYACAFL